MPTIQFYFDFLSPYAYYARHRLEQLAAQYGATLEYLPGDLKRLKLAAGNTGPATVQMPRKLAYALRDFQRWGERYGIAAASSPSCFDVRDLNAGTLYAVAQGRGPRYVAAGFEHVWGRSGVKQAPADLLRSVAETSGLELDALLRFVADPAAEAALEAIHERAVAADVFGVPTMVMQGELWWGNDRLFMLEEQLARTRLAVPA